MADSRPSRTSGGSGNENAVPRRTLWYTGSQADRWVLWQGPTARVFVVGLRDGALRRLFHDRAVIHDCRIDDHDQTPEPDASGFSQVMTMARQPVVRRHPGSSVVVRDQLATSGHRPLRRSTTIVLWRAPAVRPGHRASA